MNKKELLKLKNVLLLSTLVLTSGCGNKNDDIQKNQYGEEQSLISYDDMKDYKFLVLDNMDENEVDYYLAKVDVNKQDDRLVFYEYYDVLTDNNIYYEYFDDGYMFDKKPNVEKIYEYNVNDYLSETNNKEDYYTLEELEVIKNDMIKYYTNQNNISKDDVKKLKLNHKH